MYRKNNLAHICVAQENCWAREIPQTSRTNKTKYYSTSSLICEVAKRSNTPTHDSEWAREKENCNEISLLYHTREGWLLKYHHSFVNTLEHTHPTKTHTHISHLHSILALCNPIPPLIFDEMKHIVVGILSNIVKYCPISLVIVVRF